VKKRDNESMKKVAKGIYCFWFWNDVVTERGITEQIGEMRAAGVKGFYISPRQGLTVPYLSPQFKDLITCAVSEAKKNRITMNLCDDFPYPSGNAGGLVTLGNPAHAATQLVQKSYFACGGEVSINLPKGKVLNIIVYPVGGGKTQFNRGVDLTNSAGVTLPDETFMEAGLTDYNRKRYFSCNPQPVLAVTLPSGQWRIIASIQVAVTHFKYFNTIADVMNEDAMHEFFARTHGFYERHFHKEFGKTIPSIFVDEIEPNWSNRFPALFRKTYGYDLLPCLSALADSSHPDHGRISFAVHSLKNNIFQKTFQRPLLAWCRRNGILYAGEMPSLRLSQLNYMNIPGCDQGHLKAGDEFNLIGHALRFNPKAVSSAVYFYNKQAALCEAFHSIGWDITLEDVKFVLESLLLLGIDYFVIHAFFYSTHALRKHDAPPSLFFQEPWWPLFRHVSGRIEKLNSSFADTHIEARVLLFDPTSGVPSPMDSVAYESLLHLLLGAHIGFHIVDTDILERGKISGKSVKIKDITAEVLIIPPMLAIEPPLTRWLVKFTRAGGTVLHVRNDFDKKIFIEKLRSLVSADIDLREKGSVCADIFVVKRVGNHSSCYFLINKSSTKRSLTIQSKENLKEISLDPHTASGLRGGNGTYTRVMHPFESVLLSAVKHASNTDAGAENQVIDIEIPICVRIQPQEINLLRLDPWTMALIAENGKVYQTAVVHPMPSSNQIAKAKLRFSPRVVDHFGYTPDFEMPEMKVRYSCKYTIRYHGRLHLVMEPGSLSADEWEVCINGGKPLHVSDFNPSPFHVRGSLAADISRFSRTGENMITVNMRISKKGHGLLHAPYLAGDFSVRLPVTLEKQRREGIFADYRENGLPFYAGRIIYEFQYPLKIISQSKNVSIRLQLPKLFRDAAEVKINDSEWFPLLWNPRVFTMPVAMLQKNNAIRIRVYTTVSRVFDGEYFDYREHKYKNVLKGMGPRT